MQDAGKLQLALRLRRVCVLLHGKCVYLGGRAVFQSALTARRPGILGRMQLGVYVVQKGAGGRLSACELSCRGSRARSDLLGACEPAEHRNLPSFLPAVCLLSSLPAG